MSNHDVFQRGIKQSWTANYQQHSPKHQAGFLLKPGQWEQFDPFLIMAEDWFGRGTFGKHPHRGIETVTYVIDGRLEHYDNQAGHGELNPGDVQWMTAGRGVIHSEEPPVGETVHTLQLWVNLPREHKMAEPRYQNLRSGDMPVRREEGALLRIFSGSSKGIAAETKNHVPVTMIEFNIDAGAKIEQDLPGEFNGFFYILEGSGVFGANRFDGQQAHILWLEKGKEVQESVITVQAKEPLKALLYAGKPVQEPVVARGPFVMNTEEEIREAYRDYQEGKFER